MPPIEMLITQSKPNPEVSIEQSLITWEQFKLIQRSFASAKGIHLAYYEGILEIVSPNLDVATLQRCILSASPLEALKIFRQTFC